MLGRLTGRLGWEGHDRDVIAKALGYAGGKSGVAGRRVAAMVHFGLLARRSGIYTPTDLARQLLESPGDDSLRRDAFLHPVLFREIVERYQDVGMVPRDLAKGLVVHHGIGRNVSPEVVRIFMASAQFASVLAADGVFRTSFLERRDVSSAVAPTQHERADRPEQQASNVELTDQRTHQSIEIALTSRRFATLKIPVGLSEADVKILEAQFRVLALQAEVSQPAAPTLAFDQRRSRFRSR